LGEKGYKIKIVQGGENIGAYNQTPLNKWQFFSEWGQVNYPFYENLFAKEGNSSFPPLKKGD